MQISYEKWMSGPSGAPAAMAPELCRGESLPLPGARPGGAREGGMCTCLEADDVSARARTRSGNGASRSHSEFGTTTNGSAQEKEK